MPEITPTTQGGFKCGKKESHAIPVELKSHGTHTHRWHYNSIGGEWKGK